MMTLTSPTDGRHVTALPVETTTCWDALGLDLPPHSSPASDAALAYSPGAASPMAFGQARPLPICSASVLAPHTVSTCAVEAAVLTG